MTATATMPTSLDRPAALGFSDGIHLPGAIDFGPVIGMNGPSQNTLKKSQSSVESKHPCVYQYGSCSFGDECKFADVDGKVCAKFLKGGCSWGNNCCWKHVTPHGTKVSKMSQGNDTVRRPQHPRRQEEQQGFQDDLYGGGLQGMSLNDRNLFQQFQLQQQLNNLPPNLLGSDLPLQGGMQGMEEGGRFDHLQQMLPFPGVEDGEAMNHTTVSNFLSTITSTIREFDERHSERVHQLQLAIENVERERNEECDRNRRSISALMSSVDHLMTKLQELGVSFPHYGPNTMNGTGNAGSNNVAEKHVPSVQQSLPKTSMSHVAGGGRHDPPQKQKVCQHCGKSGRLLVCGRCRIATFCNEECQREAWSTHAKNCHPPSDS